MLDAWKHLRAILIPQILLKFLTSLVFISYICTMCKCNKQPKLRNMLRKNQNFTWTLWGTLLSTFVEQKCFMLYLTLEWFCSYFKFHTTTVIIDKRKVKILFFEKGFWSRLWSNFSHEYKFFKPIHSHLRSYILYGSEHETIRSLANYLHHCGFYLVHQTWTHPL